MALNEGCANLVQSGAVIEVLAGWCEQERERIRANDLRCRA